MAIPLITFIFKLFTTGKNQRIEFFCNEHKTILDFGKGRSTTYDFLFSIY